MPHYADRYAEMIERIENPKRRQAAREQLKADLCRQRGEKNCGRKPSASRVCYSCGVRRSFDQFPTSAKNGYPQKVCKRCKTKLRSEGQRRGHVVRTYGISHIEYVEILRRQGGGCAICGGTRRYKLEVDHDHAAVKDGDVRGSVRGLLCKRCNRRLLPAAKDDPEILMAAARYLADPPARHVL